jgi:predicted metal-dependent RNase
MFHTAKDLRGHIEILPSVPEWKFKQVTLTGHPTKELMLLFYCDSLDCVEHLFGNPIFANQISFSPIRLYRDMEQTI